MRRWIILAALVAAPWRLSGAACGTSGVMVNGFEGGGSVCGAPESGDAANWTVGSDSGLSTFSPGTALSAGVAVQEGTNLGVLDFIAGAKLSWIDLNAAGLVESGTNWNSYNYIYTYYATTASAGTYGEDFTTAIYLTPTSGSVQGFRGANINIETGAWTAQIVSLNYARNMGMNFNAMTGLEIQEYTSTLGGGQGYVSFDELALTTTARDQPPSAITTGGGSVSACNSVSLTWGAPTAGTDPVSGFHIYRSTVSAAGPWTSRAYLYSNSATGFIDSAVPITGAVYYVILPFSTTSAAFGNPGYFTLMAGDPAAPTTGVNEDLIGNAVPVTVLNPQAQCSPTPSPSPSKSPSSSPTPSRTATQTSTSTSTDTNTPSPTDTPTATATPTATNTPSPSSTDTASPTRTPSATVVVGSPTATATDTLTATSTVTPSDSPTSNPAATAAPTLTASPTPVPGAPTLTFTIPPPPTLVVGVPAQLFPNPYHANQGLFHLGNVAPDLKVGIYNMIGQQVRTFRTTGNPQLDTWDGTNSNGVKVVTGIYFVVIQGNVYRLAVVRD